MSNVIIPGRPARPIQVETTGVPSVRVDAGGRIPPGGTAGQALVKASDGDYATLWGTASAAAAWGAITGTLASQADLQAALDAKQATLVSGTNIKTLNGSTILGSGDLVISASAAWGGITGTLSAQTDLQAALNARQPLATVLTNTTASFTTAQETKLAGIATGATANSSDATLLARANHTGTQIAATISDFATAVAATAAVTANTAKVTNATHTGDVTGATALTIANDAVTNAKLANVATASIKGRVTAATGDPEDLTGTQATTLLDTFTSALKGLVPASGGGTTNFLRADGTWAAAGGGGGGPTGGSATINFGAAPGTNIAEVVITGQGAIASGARARAWIQGDSTAEHNAYEHTRVLARHVSTSCENISAGVGFTIVASTELRLTGNVGVRWEWSA